MLQNTLPLLRAPYTDITILADILLVLLWVSIGLMFLLKMANTIYPIGCLKNIAFFQVSRNTAFENAFLFLFMAISLVLSLVSRVQYDLNMFSQLENKDKFADSVIILFYTYLASRFVMKFITYGLGIRFQSKYLQVAKSSKFEYILIYLLLVLMAVFWIMRFFHY